MVFSPTLNRSIFLWVQGVFPDAFPMQPYIFFYTQPTWLSSETPSNFSLTHYPFV